MGTDSSKPFRYRGPLGKRIPLLDSLHAQNRGYYGEWMATRQVEGLRLLFEFYDISDHNDEDRWFELALALASTHVPAFQIDDGKTKGRPPKPKPLSKLLRLKPARRGAPKKYSIADKESLISVVEHYKEALKESRKAGRPVGIDHNMRSAIKDELRQLDEQESRITDLAAIRTLLRDYAKATNKSFLRMNSDVKRYQKRLSEARKEIREIRNNKPG